MAFHSSATILEAELRAHRRACRLREQVSSWQEYGKGGEETGLSDCESCSSLSDVGVTVRDSITDMSDQSLLNDEDSSTEAQTRTTVRSILKVFSKSNTAYSKLDGRQEKEQEHSDDFAIEMSALSMDTPHQESRLNSEREFIDFESTQSKECSSTSDDEFPKETRKRSLSWAEGVIDNSPEMYEDQYMDDGWGTMTYPRPPKRLSYYQKVELFKDRPDLQPSRDWARKHRQSTIAMLCRLSIPIGGLVFFILCIIWILKTMYGTAHQSRGR